MARSAHWSAVNSYGNMSCGLHRSNSHRSAWHANHSKRNPPLSLSRSLSLAQFALILSRALCICLNFHLHTMWRIVFVARSTHFFSANVSSFSNIFMLVLYPLFFCLFLTAATFSGNFLLGAASRLRLLLAKSVNGNWWTHLRIVVDDRQSQVAKLQERDGERALSSEWLIERESGGA